MFCPTGRAGHEEYDNAKADSSKLLGGIDPDVMIAQCAGDDHDGSRSRSKLRESEPKAID